MTLRKLPLAPLAPLALLVGCATNHLDKFYVDKTQGAPVPKEFRKVKPSAYPSSEDIQADVSHLVGEEGCLIVGYSDYWTSHPPTIQDLQRKGQQVGATRVLCSTRYRETVTQYQPMYNYVPGTTATYNSSGNVIANGSATVYGNGWTGYGNAQANGYYSTSATASTPGRVEYAGSRPVNTRLYDVRAVFLRDPPAPVQRRNASTTATDQTVVQTSARPLVNSDASAAQADPSALTPSEAFQLALRYDSAGETTKAIVWLMSAAKRGLPNAQYALGEHYRDGKGFKADQLAAFKWTSVALTQPPTRWEGSTDSARLDAYKAALDAQTSIRASLNDEQKTAADDWVKQLAPRQTP